MVINEGERCSLEKQGFVGVYYPGTYRTNRAIIASGGASCDEKLSVAMSRFLRDGIDGFTCRENFRRFIMIGKLIIEVLIMWILYAIYMAILVHGKGPVGGIFFYPMAMQDRVVELGLTTKDKIKRGKTFAFVLLFVWMFVAPMIMILIVNRTRSYLGCCIQFYILFLGAEFFDWLAIDTIWVAMSDWWLIPETEDLNDTWHNVNVKKWKFVKLIPFSVPVAAIVGGIYFLIGKIF